MNFLNNAFSSFRGNPPQQSGSVKFGQGESKPSAEKIVIPLPDKGHYRVTIVDEPNEDNPNGLRISFIA